MFIFFEQHSVSLFVTLSICLTRYFSLFLYLDIYLSISPSRYLSLSIYPAISLSLSLSLSLSPFLSLSRSVCISLFLTNLLFLSQLKFQFFKLIRGHSVYFLKIQQIKNKKKSLQRYCITVCCFLNLSVFMAGR